MQNQRKIKTSELINSFTIERLLKSKNNKQSVKSFINKRNPSLQSYLRKEAWNADSQHETVTYLIKDKNEIVCYFTLRCGTLVPKGSKRLKENEESSTDDTFHVNTIIPAIEIAQFCMNEAWLKNHEDRKGCGELIFYFYILPIVKKLSEFIGCSHMYLYAADNTEDETLIKYYEKLKFKKASSASYYQLFSDYEEGCTLMISRLTRFSKVDFSTIADLESELRVQCFEREQTKDMKEDL